MNRKLILGVVMMIAVISGVTLIASNYQAKNQASLAGVPIVSPVGSCPASGYKYVTQWGYWTANASEVATDSNGNVYVSVLNDHTVIKFSPTGAYMFQWANYWAPFGMDIDSSGIYVVDDDGTGQINQNYIIKSNVTTGTVLSEWGTHGAGNGQFDNPRDLDRDSAGNIYVADTDNNRIQKLSPTGAYVTQWGGFGSANGQFKKPTSVVLDAFGNVYVADSGNNRIQKFSSSGVFITKWGTSGSNSGQFNEPLRVAVDNSSNVYVADVYNFRIQKFTSTGAYITQWGTPGAGNGQFDKITGVAVDGLGNVYVLDSGNNRVQKFSPCTQTPTLPASIMKPDLIVEDFTWTPANPRVRVITDPTKEPSPNTNFQIRAIIKNIGPVAATLPVGTQVSFTKGGVSYGKQQLISPVTLQPNQTLPVTIYQSTTPNILGTPGTFGVTVAVDDYAAATQGTSYLVIESNETNNTLTKQMTIVP